MSRPAIGASVISPHRPSTNASGNRCSTRGAVSRAAPPAMIATGNVSTLAASPNIFAPASAALTALVQSNSRPGQPRISGFCFAAGKWPLKANPNTAMTSTNALKITKDGQLIIAIWTNASLPSFHCASSVQCLTAPAHSLPYQEISTSRGSSGGSTE